MFHIMRNGSIRGTTLERTALGQVQRRLPSGWSLTLERADRANRVLAIEGPDGRTTKVVVQSRQKLTPRDIPGLVRSARVEGAPLLVLAPFFSPRSRELLVDLGASYADSSGNLRVAIDSPALFIEGRGADRDPTTQPRALRSLKGAAAGRVVRALCDFLPPYGVRTLAEASSTPLGSVSRVISLLDEESLITRDKKKQVLAVDWPALLRRWTRDYDVKTSNRLSSYLEPRGLPALTDKLTRLDERHAVTGSMAGPGIAPARLAMIYVDDAAKAALAMGLTPAEAGANVWLLEPYDQVVFERVAPPPAAQGAQQQPVLVCASPSQVAADLLTSPGRGPQEAEALIERMEASEDGWRRRP